MHTFEKAGLTLAIQLVKLTACCKKSTKQILYLHSVWQTYYDNITIVFALQVVQVLLSYSI